ncbi:hypothetical protein L207DRAFT_510130 [Hyaloscypha variabilis F]|uniref:2EXR domain-containing protein n=1 Tax=Hyaloscypha variabilis (strain UAMH 11265 / GT02V1 / F) TaxID=1149755 RepID=A0A2J6RYN3_HYAVF|nr:hypothetical protein L207DRAFT_510130 [Hyaloscypha variabilis F]
MEKPIIYRHSKLAVLEPKFFYEPIKVSHALTHSFHRFAAFPPEIRLLIWRAAIPVDFSNTPISVKPYSYTYLDQRVPPKTLSINRESRHETLKYFRRLEVRAAEVSDSVRAGHNMRWLRKYPSQIVLWDKMMDVLTLDWWCLVEDVKDVVKYLNLQPFVDPQKEQISCVQILDIDTQAWNSHPGSHYYGPLGQVLGQHVIGSIEKKLSYFVGLRELRLSKWSARRSYNEERDFMGVFEACFKRLAKNNPDYCIPRIILVLDVGYAARKLLS